MPTRMSSYSLLKIMQNKKQIDDSFKFINSLKSLATAYEQISVTKMQRARGGVLASRDYLEQLAQVFNQVKMNYNNEVQKLLKKKHREGSTTFSTIAKNGKSIAILLSTNSKLHGDVGKKVFRLFLKNVEQNNPDIYVIGKVGKELFEGHKSGREYRYIDFPDNQKQLEAFQPNFEILEEYETVTVYYGKFVNVLTQNAEIANISGTENIGNTSEEVQKVHYYFEPSLENVLQFFEGQIFSALFKQAIQESSLSSDASRIRQMESALENIEGTSQSLVNARRRVKKRTENSKQIQRLLGRKLWRNV